jgi:hypothetical protein
MKQPMSIFPFKLRQLTVKAIILILSSITVPALAQTPPPPAPASSSSTIGPGADIQSQIKNLDRALAQAEEQERALQRQLKQLSKKAKKDSVSALDQNPIILNPVQQPVQGVPAPDKTGSIEDLRKLADMQRAIRDVAKRLEDQQNDAINRP